MSEPLRISVEIARDVRENYVDMPGSISDFTPAIDARVRPLVDLLRECRAEIMAAGEYRAPHPTVERIDAALRDAE